MELVDMTQHMKIYACLSQRAADAIVWAAILGGVQCLEQKDSSTGSAHFH